MQLEASELAQLWVAACAPPPGGGPCTVTHITWGHHVESHRSSWGQEQESQLPMWNEKAGFLPPGSCQPEGSGRSAERPPLLSESRAWCAFSRAGDLGMSAPGDSASHLGAIFSVPPPSDS